ncbi:MAG: XrtA/PEP-CTERM system histidine kinase PrsK [Betaproteobacteria bacterium]
MNLPPFSVASVAYGFGLVAHLALAIYLARSGRSVAGTQQSRWPVAWALLASAAWCAASLLSLVWNDLAAVFIAQATDLARYALWFTFLILLLPQDGQGQPSPATRVMRRVAIGSVTAAALLMTLAAVGALEGEVARLAIAGALALPVCGLLMVEQLFRNLREDQRWNAKPVCLGLACVFVFDIYLFAEGLLFGKLDPEALAARGGVHALAVPFLFVAARRSPNWIAKLHVSRAAAFYSASLLLAGAYLLFMAAVGYYVRFFGGEWGRALQLGLVVAALALLGMLAFSGALRSWLRVFVGKHFYSYRYDYREEWLRFTAMLSANRSPQETGEMIVRGLAKMLECPAGTLWTRQGDGGYAQSAAWNMPVTTEIEAAESSLVRFLATQGWVIDLDEFRSSPRRYGELALPTWLLGARNGWLVVPLMVGDELQGFVLLARPLTAIKLNWEVLDLLKTAGRQAAGYLAQMQATEALLDARKFEAFNKMSAFVVHDLKNIVAQLSLMLKNAERLHDNREFQQDMLLTVESSLEKMKRLMLQLREGAKPPGGSRGVELQPIVRRLVAMARAQGRTLETDEGEHLFTRGHDDRLERVLGHLVQNALDATPAGGRVWLRTSRAAGSVRVEVGDTGSGMTEEFVRNQLFRPFSSTKSSGMGIGSFESAQYVRELGGSIDVASRPGEGSVFTVLLPAFEAPQGSDLMRPVAR